MSQVIHNQKLVTAAEKVMDSSVAFVSAVAVVLGIVPDPSKATPEELSDIKTGLTNRAVALCKAEYYSRNGDTYAKVTESEFKKLEATKAFMLTATYANDTTTYELGQMNQKEPGKHKIVARMRKKISTNVSNRWKDIQRIARGDFGTGESVTRQTYTDRKKAERGLALLNKTFANSRKKGNPSAPSAERVALAEAAYMKHAFG